MKTKEILSIFALVAIVLCLICGVAKTAMKSPKQKQSCDTACSILIFVAVVLVGISQLLDETVTGGGKVPRKIASLAGVLGSKCLDGKCIDGKSVCKVDGGDMGGIPICMPKPGTYNGSCLHNVGSEGYPTCDKGLSCGSKTLGGPKVCLISAHPNPSPSPSPSPPPPGTFLGTCLPTTDPYTIPCEKGLVCASNPHGKGRPNICLMPAHHPKH